MTMLLDHRRPGPALPGEDPPVTAGEPTDRVDAALGALLGRVLRGFGDDDWRAVLGVPADRARRQGISRIAGNRLSPEEEPEFVRRLHELVRREHRRFVAHALAKVGDRATAEDLVQDAYTSVFHAKPRLTGPDALTRYVRRAVHHKILSHHSRRSTRPTTVGLDDAAHLATLFDAAGLPDDERIVWKLHLASLLRALSVRQREVLRDRYVDDLSEKEIACRRGISLGAVKRYHHDAMKALRAALAA